MSVTSQMLRSWRAPRAVMARLLAGPEEEARAFGYLMAACFLIFVAQWPRLTRLAEGFEVLPGQDVPELPRLIAYEFMSWLVVWPLLFYGLAAISRWVATRFGGQLSPYRARLALFWALLASVPVLLVHGVLTGFLGTSLLIRVVGAVWFAGFAYIWLMSLREAKVTA